MRLKVVTGRRTGIYLFIMAAVTALNLLLMVHIHMTGDLRADIRQNFIIPFSKSDVGCGICITAVSGGALYLLRRLQMKAVHVNRKKAAGGKISPAVLFLFLILAWSVIFAALFPGTAINDTISILQNPAGAAAQHPVNILVR